MKTGLISPYYRGGGRHSRLKKASYEGRIGDVAYKYKDGATPDVVFRRKLNTHLVVPKNSIVFVECDLEFRLPDYVALRFNLQIRHVHQGLLLGTGPLVDPGFWGKLCIPLHNLTNEDYKIPKDEGLIWVEFTKTSSPDGKPSSTLGRAPLDIDDNNSGIQSINDGYFDILRYLDKASTVFGFDTGRLKVPIASSLPDTVRKNANLAGKAQASAEQAEKDLKTIRIFITIGGLAAGISLLVLTVSIAALVINTNRLVNDIQDRIETLEETLD